jgi:uncharacterized membrane protein
MAFFFYTIDHLHIPHLILKLNGFYTSFIGVISLASGRMVMFHTIKKIDRRFAK